jgi:hypothetical protein
MLRKATVKPRWSSYSNKSAFLMAPTELSGWTTQASSLASLDGAAYPWEAVSQPVCCFHVALIAVSIDGPRLRVCTAKAIIPFATLLEGMPLLSASILSLTVVTERHSYNRKQLSVVKPCAEPLESLPVLVQVPSFLQSLLPDYMGRAYGRHDKRLCSPAFFCSPLAVGCRIVYFFVMRRFFISFFLSSLCM